MPVLRIPTAPIVVGPHVVIGTQDGLYVLDATTGAIVSSDALAGILGPDEQIVSAPLAGFSAAGGMLFVPVGNKLVAY